MTSTELNLTTPGRLLSITVAILILVSILVATLIRAHQSSVARKILRAFEKQFQAILEPNRLAGLDGLSDSQRQAVDTAILNRLRHDVLKLASDYAVDCSTLAEIESLEQRIAQRVATLQ